MFKSKKNYLFNSGGNSIVNSKKNILLGILISGTTFIISNRVKKFGKNYLKNNSNLSHKYPILKKKIFRNLRIKSAAITLIIVVISNKKSNTILFFKSGNVILRKSIKFIYNKIRAKKSIPVLPSSTTNSDTIILKTKRIVTTSISIVVIIHVFSPQIIGFICGLYFDVQDPRWWQNIKSLRYWRRYILSRLVIIIENPNEPDD